MKIYFSYPTYFAMLATSVEVNHSACVGEHCAQALSHICASFCMGNRVHWCDVTKIIFLEHFNLGSKF